MDKHYLLRFNEDYGDEHNVPALSCMKEYEYNKWLKTPSGELNPNYEKELKIFNDYQTNYKNFSEKINKILGNGWGSIQFTKWPKYLLLEYESLVSADYPVKCFSNMSAYLGNSGECFEENYHDFHLMEDFVKNNIVTVLEVDESFYNFFHKASLGSMSLCNVFEITN